MIRSGVTSGPGGGVKAPPEIKRSEPWPQLEQPASHRHQLLPVPGQRLPQREPSAGGPAPDPRRLEGTGPPALCWDLPP